MDVLLATKRAAKGLHLAELYHDDGVLIVNRNHPRVGRKLSSELFNSLQHIDVLTTPGQEAHTRKLYQRFLKKHHLSRQVILTVPSFSAAAMAVAQTDYAAGIPRRVAAALSKYLPLKLMELPFEGFFANVALIWHARTEVDPVARYFREVVISALRG